MATSRISLDRPASSSSSPSFSPPPLSLPAAGQPPRLAHPEYARPRLSFCWVCSGRLVHWIHRTCLVHGNEVITHARCARKERLELKPGEQERLSMPIARIVLEGGLDAMEAIVQSACRGDRIAIGAVAAVFGPMLHDEARGVLGGDARQADLALDAFFASLCQGRTSFPPAPGRAVAWMKGIVRAIARRQVAKGGRS